ncbi:MAG TPA: DUF4157 domain-containing protein, partial [Pyrinomonadaceae bacterium]|nr:DUF4157 domain-containing protein [Pyrinomonadaceae bacterium]
QGKPVQLGLELPPVGATQWDDVKYEDGTTGWNPECVMGILCQQDSAIIKQLPSLDVKMLDNIEVKQWLFDGKSWSHKEAYPLGLNKADEKLIGVVKRATCNYAAQTMFHEVHHQNQHAHVKETVFTMEVDAYTETEKWAIERGLPEELTDIQKSLRTTNKQGEEIPSSKAIEKKVTEIYGGPTPAPGEQKTGGQAESKEGEKTKEVVGQVKGHKEPNTTLVKVPGEDELVPRPSKKGDKYLEDPPKITPPKPEPVPPEVWKCPKEKSKDEKEKPKDEKAVPLQRSAKSPEMPDTVPPVVHEVLNSSGQPLDADTRELMESRFGHDFGRVRVHADAKAAESARAVNALAYTVKHHVAFDAGRYSPDTRDGQSLLAHELAHVVQQSRGASAPLSLSQNSYLERAADQAASALGRETGPVHVPGASAPAIARQPAEAEAEVKEENIATPGEVKVIPDKAAGKLRVVYVKDGQILAGLAEITPPQGTPLNPLSVQVYAQWSGTEKYPQVRIQTPKEWSSTINLRQDVAVKRGESEMDEHHVTDMTKAEVEALRQELIQWIMESGGSKFYELSANIAGNYQRATPAEIKEAGKLSGFQEWKAKRENAARVNAENAAYQQHMGMEGFTKAEAREAVEYYQGRALRTEWEREQYARGALQSMEEIRDPRTGVVFAYRDRKLRGVGREFYGTEEFVYDIFGNPLSSQGLGVKAAYGPQDYILDPFGIQDLTGVAEADPTLSIVSDLATGGAKLAIKGGAKGVKSLVNLGRRGVTEGVETLARAGERELAHEGIEGLSRTVKSEEVAEAVANQAARSEGESLARGASRSERAAEAVSQQARAEARAASTEVKGAESALAKEGQAQGPARTAGGEASVARPTSERKVVAEHAAEGHEYKVLDDGTVIRCSDRCGPVRNRLAQFEKTYPQADGLDKLKKEWAEIEALQDANLKSRRAAEFDRQLKASFAANRKQAKAAAGAAGQSKAARQGVSSAAKASKANAPLPEITKLPHERGYAGQVEKRYLAESQQEWEKLKAGGKESEVSFARHEQDFNSLSKTLNNKQQALAQAGQPHL